VGELGREPARERRARRAPVEAIDQGLAVLVVPEADRRGVAARDHGGDGHRLVGGPARHRDVVGVAVVGGDPVVGAGGGGGVALGGGATAGERLGVGEQRGAGAGGVAVEPEGDGAGGVVAAGDVRLVGDRGADGGGGRHLLGVDP